MYRSLRFLPTLTETLRTLEYPNLEFLISDRHHEDDAIDRLQQTFGGDPRFRFLAAEDRIDWVSHYNLLLREASGEYFVWVSHDDSYSSDFIVKLVQALERDPRAILASARPERIGMNGERLTHVKPKLPVPEHAPGPLQAYRVAMSGGLQFHGVFRRRMLLERKLLIRPTIGNIAADMLWIFTVAQLGPAIYVGDCTFWKRYYPASTHKSWDSIIRPSYVWNFARVASSYLDDYASTSLQRISGKTLAYLASGLWGVRLWLRALRLRMRRRGIGSASAAKNRSAAKNHS